MCGIAGIVGTGGPNAVSAMLSSLEHRGPDGRGTHHGDGYSLGHTRLSIIDLPGGAQPMGDGSDGWQVTFNGEIYNYRQLRAGIGESRFRTHSDTEVLLQLARTGSPVDHWVRRLDGMFAFALVRTGEVTLARDPLGVKPLYLARERERLMFASELKALPASAREVTEFPPAHVFTQTGGLRPYYRLPRSAPDVCDAEVAKTGLRQRLEEAVVSRLVTADVPVGVFLSGGLDSSLIAALARRHKDPLETFSVCTEDGADRPAALEMARYLNTRHHERLYTVREALDALPEVIYHLESFDCALVRSAVPNFFLARLAREHVKVALAGEGADELFAGYAYLKDIPLPDLDGELRHITAALHNTNLQRCDRMSMAHGLEVRVPFLDDLAVVEYAFRLPVRLKQHGRERTEKWILRKVAEDLLPPHIAWRTKSKFAIGSGLGDQLARCAERQISDAAFLREREIAEDTFLTCKEELLYYRVFRQMYPREDLLPLVGRSRSL